MAKFRRRPTRAETARASGARSRGPATPEGKARSRLNGLAHGLRARSLAPVAALGETPELVAAHVAAYRREFPAPGPCPRDLAAARLRAARLEAELLAGLAEGGRSIGRWFHDDPDTRAALALVQRYHREAELAASRARRELEALARARAAGLLADEEEAAAAEADLDAALAEYRPNEPCPAGPWRKAGAPTPCTGRARGVGGRNEPRERARLLARSRPALFGARTVAGSRPGTRWGRGSSAST